MNAIHGEMRQDAYAGRVPALVETLVSYTSSHFAAEEAKLRCEGCPLYEANCQAHSRFIQRVRIWHAMASSGAPARFAPERHLRRDCRMD